MQAVKTRSEGKDASFYAASRYTSPAAPGRKSCADPSTISTTFNRCSAENVAQLREVVPAIVREQSQACRHGYDQKLQVLDVDMSGMPAGSQGEGVEKGYLGDP